jgi:hypothetical protein
VRHELDQAIGTEPVSTVDVDDVVARGRRSVRRRLTVAAAAGSSLVAIGVVVALVLTSAGRAPAPNPVLPAAARSTAQTHDDTAPVRDGETLDQAKRRLAAALTQGLTAALPGVALADAPTGQAGVVVYAEPDTDTPYNTDTVLMTAAGAGEAFLESWPGGGTPAAAAPTNWPSGQPAPPVAITWFESCADLPRAQAFTPDGKQLVDECQDSTGPDGQKVVAVTERCPDCAGHPTFRYDVYVTWSNARISLSIARDTKRGDAQDYLTAPLLTREQAIAIALDPELTVTS